MQGILLKKCLELAHSGDCHIWSANAPLCDCGELRRRMRSGEDEGLEEVWAAHLSDIAYTIAGGRDILQALQAIDLIVSDDFCEDLDMQRASHGLKGDLATAQEKLSLIYKIAHSENPSHSCHHVHGNWRRLKEVVLDIREGEKPRPCAQTP